MSWVIEFNPLCEFDLFQEHDRMMLYTYHPSRLAGRVIRWAAPEPDPNPGLRLDHRLEVFRNLLGTTVYWVRFASRSS